MSENQKAFGEPLGGQTVEKYGVPWRVEQIGNGFCIFKDGVIGHYLAECFHEDKKEIAARIVACVNFCEGICLETIQLTNHSGFPLLKWLCEENQSLRTENASLKAGIQELIAVCESGPTSLSVISRKEVSGRLHLLLNPSTQPKE